MALATIFPSFFAKGPTFRQQKTNDALPQGINPSAIFDLEEAFTVQASLNEEYNYSAEATQNEVESGSDITDHIKQLPVEVSMTMRQTDHPITFGSVLRGAAVSAGSSLGQRAGGALGQIGGGVAAGALTGLLSNIFLGQRPTLNCYEQFVSLWKAGAIMSIQTGLAKFDDMAIISLNFSRTQKSGQGMDFTVRFRQIRIVSQQNVKIPLISDLGVSDQATKTADLGRQNEKVVSGPRQSWLSSISQSIF